MVQFLLLIAAIYLGLCVVLFVAQRSLIYFPTPPSADNAPRLVLTVDDAKLQITARPNPGVKALVYFGGNAEDVAYSLPELAAAFPDHALFLMHYRGYGGSTGSPSEVALVADAVALFDRVRADHPDIVIVGRSLGSGIAVQLASLRPAVRLILVTPYNSLLELAARQFPYVPVAWLLRDRFESWRYAERMTVPTLLIAAEHDEIIPAASTEALRKRFPPGIATLRIVPGTGHNSLGDHPAYISFLKGG